MRRGSGLPWLAGLAVLALSACAHVEAPPGGPEDTTGPQLVVSRPDSNAIVPTWSGPVVLGFDERVSERGIDQAVEVSPRTSAPVVSHGGNELRVRLREGWQSGVIYHISVLPELRDLFGNQIEAPIRLVFSTGPDIPENRLEVQAVDRVTGNPADDARIEAIRLPDSLVYVLRGDTSGIYSIEGIPEGDYMVRAYDDLNVNRRLDPFEPADSAATAVPSGDTAAVRLAIVAPDTVPPRVAETAMQQRQIVITFDDYLDPTQPLTLSRITVRDSAGIVQPISRMGIGVLPPAERPEGDEQSEEPRPSQRLLIELAPEVEPQPGATYVVEIVGIRNIVGLSSNIEATVTAPAEPNSTTGDANSHLSQPAITQ